MESASFDCHTIINKIQSIATDLLYCLPSAPGIAQKVSKLIGWKPLASGFFKLNSDGLARRNPRKAGATAIIRDSTGAWISSRTRKIGHAHSMAAELWGLRDGLMLAKSLNIRKLLVEVDVCKNSLL